MKKAAMIKDLNFEIDRLKQELYATREKNGVYIPKELYLHKESEKKAMTEKIECLELDLESKDKQLNGLQERFDSELQLNEEIIEKFEKKSKNLEDTKRAFLDLEEKYIQTNSMIKEMEYLISNLLKSEKDLVERVYELQSELETAAADISRMSSKIECKDKIEVGNKILIQRFRSELTQQLESLHRTVSVSVMEQEIQLKEMEDEMRSFISTKTKTSDVLRGRVEILKSTYDSGFRALDSLAGELDENSQSNFEKLNSRVLQHSSVLEDCFKEIALEADQLLNELQNSLSNQEDKLAVFAWQQREVHFRVVETTRSISKSAIYFFHTLDIHVSKVSTVLEESKTVQDKQLCELEKKFGEFSANEERQLLEKMMEMLASSSARKKKMVQMAVDSLRASAADRIDNLQSEVSSAQTLTSSIKYQWEVYMEETKIHYLEDTDAIESGRCSLKEGFQHCMATIKLASQQWRDAQKSLSTHGKTGVTSVDTVIRSGMEANRLLQGELCSTAATAIGEIDDVLSSIDCSSKLDHDVHTNVDSTIVSCRGELMELKSEHYRKTAEIIENAGKCFEVEYMVDEPSSSIPRRSIKFSSSASIDELRTPAFEELSKSFREARNQANGDTKHYLEAHESLQPQDFRDARIPLTAIN